MSEIEQYIKNTFMLKKREEIDVVKRMFVYKKLRKGDVLAETDKDCDFLALVKTGFLRMYNISDGDEVTQWISSKGYFATDITSFFFQNPSRWTIQALTDTEVFVISRNEYKSISHVVENWSELQQMFLVGCFSTMENRIYNHLSMTSEERYNHFFENNRELFNQVPIKYIASMLGMTAETMSRIRKKQSSQIS